MRNGYQPKASGDLNSPPNVRGLFSPPPVLQGTTREARNKSKTLRCARLIKDKAEIERADIVDAAFTYMMLQVVDCGPETASAYIDIWTDWFLGKYDNTKQDKT